MKIIKKSLKKHKNIYLNNFLADLSTLNHRGIPKILVSNIHCIMCWPVICPVCVIVITPAFFGLGNFRFSGACEAPEDACCATFTCGGCCCWYGFPPLFLPSPLPFPFPWRHSFKESFPSIPFLPLLAFSFSPESCVLLVIVPCCITFTFWPRTEARVLIFFLSFRNPSTFLSWMIGRANGA